MQNGFVVLNGKPLTVHPVALPEGMELSPQPKRAFVEILPNGKSYTTLDIKTGSDLDDTGVFNVPMGHVFVMGDNRDNSKDSRTNGHGYVPLEAIYGRIDHLLLTL